MADDHDKKLYEQAKRRVQFKESLLGFILANVICWAIYFLTDKSGSWWPLWVTFGTGIFLVGSFIHASSLYSVDNEYERLKKGQK